MFLSFGVNCLFKQGHLTQSSLAGDIGTGGKSIFSVIYHDIFEN